MSLCDDCKEEMTEGGACDCDLVVPGWADVRETLGRQVRDEWILWAKERESRCRMNINGLTVVECGKPVGKPWADNSFRCEDNHYNSPVKPSWLVPWEELSEPDKEVDRRIGERLWKMGQRSAMQNMEGK